MEEKKELLSAFQMHINQLTEERAQLQQQIAQSQKSLADAHQQMAALTQQQEQKIRALQQGREASEKTMRQMAGELARAQSECKSQELQMQKMRTEWNDEKVRISVSCTLEVIVHHQE
jgi:chromosome segregation ATPase